LVTLKYTTGYRKVATHERKDGLEHKPGEGNLGRLQALKDRKKGRIEPPRHGIELHSTNEETMSTKKPTSTPKGRNSQTPN